MSYTLTVRTLINSGDPSLAFVVEDGTGLNNAVSFCSVADATVYHESMGQLAAWSALTTAQAEVALRKATEYMEQVFAERWKGYRYDNEQALSWPRAGAIVHGLLFPYNEVPGLVVSACAELALKAHAGPLLPDVSTGVEAVDIGPLSVRYSGGGGSPRYSAVEARLAPYMRSSSTLRRLER